MSKSNNPVALLFCQDIDGHRQNYVAVLGKWFLSKGYKVIVALTNAEDGSSPADTPVLGRLLKNQRVLLVELGDTKTDSGITGFWVHRIRMIEDEVQPTWTVLIVGDQCRQTLFGLGTAGRPSMTRRAGIFIYVNHVYKPDLRGTSLPRKVWRYLRWWQWQRRESRYFAQAVWSEMGLDKIITTNENFWRMANDERICLIPEIYRAWGFEMLNNDPMIEKNRKDYQSFLIRNPDREIILYYGTRFARRGYDTLLALACDHVDTVFVSCGREAEEQQSYEHDVAYLREQLKSEGRLFEINLPFLPENPLIDDLFKSVHFVLLPYRQWYGMSGSFFQAVSYGKPVLVPDIGHMAATVRKYSIGLTYTAIKKLDFINKFEIIKGKRHKYITALEAFASEYNEISLFKALERTFTS